MPARFLIRVHAPKLPDLNSERRTCGTAPAFPYEHVRDYGTWESVLSRLSDRTINDVWSLWKSRLSDAKMAALRKLLEQQRRPVPTR
jgi:hypothetical protein